MPYKLESELRKLLGIPPEKRTIPIDLAKGEMTLETDIRTQRKSGYRAAYKPVNVAGKVQGP